MPEPVRYEARDGIGVITLDRPDNRNSMTPELLDAFAHASAAARADGDIRVLVVTGTGRCFSAGADFTAGVQRGGDDLAPHERSYAMYEPFLSLLDIAVPIIGALNGHAVGGGFGLALVCDIRIAAQEAKYGANFVALGLAPGMAISHLLPRLIGLGAGVGAAVHGPPGRRRRGRAARHRQPRGAGGAGDGRGDEGGPRRSPPTPRSRCAPPRPRSGAGSAWSRAPPHAPRPTIRRPA